MEYRLLGRSGLRVSALSFGSWVTFGEQIDDFLGLNPLALAAAAALAIALVAAVIRLWWVAGRDRWYGDMYHAGLVAPQVGAVRAALDAGYWVVSPLARRRSPQQLRVRGLAPYGRDARGPGGRWRTISGRCGWRGAICAMCPIGRIRPAR